MMRPYPRWRPVIASVCRRHRIGWRDVVSKSRLPGIVRCRFEIWWQIRTLFGASFLEIGKRTGGFDHTSVMYGVRRWGSLGRPRGATMDHQSGEQP